MKKVRTSGAKDISTACSAGECEETTRAAFFHPQQSFPPLAHCMTDSNACSFQQT